MAAPEGNKFWKLRLKHGRKHKIETAQEIWDNFEEYAQQIESTPLIEVDFRGKDAIKVEIPKMRAMTKEHFALCCGLSGWEKLEQYKERGEDFSEIITRVEKYIYYQKFAGSAAGFLNPNIIARELGLTEKIERSSKQNIIIESSSKEEEKNIKKSLDNLK